MVGDILRQEREKKGLSIADVAAETSIRDTYLEAIEEGNYDVLPGDVYTKGFIRNYARFLEIDGTPLLEQFAAERNIVKEVQPVDSQQPAEPVEQQTQNNVFTPSKKTKQETVQQESSKPEPKQNLFAAGDAYRNSLAKEESSGTRKFLILLAVMLVFLVGVYVAFMDDGTVEAPSKPTTQVTQQAAAPAPVKVYDGVEISAKMLENCWISVKVDGQDAFEGTLEKGKEMTWQGKESVEMIAGNAGGIEITCNGKNLGTLGEVGQVADRTFTKADGQPDTTEDAAAENAQAQEETAAQQEAAPSYQYEESAAAPAAPAAPAPVEPAPAPAPAPEPAAPAAPAPAEPAPAAPAEAPAAAPAAE